MSSDQPGWHRDAACAEPEVSADWFHSRDIRETRHAKRICRGCPVKAQCLRDALVREDDWGVWGGLSDRERRQMRRQAQLRPVA